jgi:hypothetical protein
MLRGSTRAAQTADNISMFRGLGKVVFIGVLVAAGSVGIFLYYGQFSTDRKLAQLEDDNRQLHDFVQRLTGERRVAQLLVSDQRQVNGVQKTTLLFEEYARDGSILPPRTFTIEGNMVHIEAMVIKFDHDFVEKDDPLKGRSIALFCKLYGDRQRPDQGFVIDEPGQIPDYYRGADPQVSAFETQLWQNFWRLADDPAYRQEMGVRVPNGEGPWRPVYPDQLYTITLEFDGGLNITSQPIKRPVGA